MAQSSDTNVLNNVFSPLQQQQQQQMVQTPVSVRPVGGDLLTASKPKTQPLGGSTEPQPYGSQLFSTAAALVRPQGMNPEYLVSPGDQVSVQMYGAQSHSSNQVVDPQGNIFVPEVGPIKVAGRPVAALNSVVGRAIKEVFTENVSVYVNVTSRQPVGVYVTGSVRTPGRFSGDRTAGVLTFLAQAGGIDPKSGSYRNVRVLRGEAVLANIDLYEFLLAGRLPAIQFQDNDTIVVGTQGTTVTAKGLVQNSYRFEVDIRDVNGSDILRLSRPEASASHVSLQGMREGRPFNAYITIEDFSRAQIANGDEATFVADRVSETIFVNVLGQANGPSSFAIPQGAKLGDVLKLIEVNPELADLDSIYLRRKSVAERQERALELSLSELQRAVLTTQSSTPAEAGMRVQEAALVERFIEKAQTVKPEGRLLLAGSPNRNDVRLMAEDVIVIPQVSEVVMIAGDVRMPQTLLWNKGMSIDEYADQAGGFTDRADTGKFVVIRRSGATEVGSDIEIQPGDQIMVMPSASSKTFAVFKDLLEVIYHIAVSSAVVINVTK